MKNPLILASLCALAWGTWPILANASKASSVYITSIVCAVTAVCAIAFYLLKGTFYSEISLVLNSGTNKMLFLPVLAGVLNVVGMIFYGMLLSSNSGFEVTKYVPISTALLPIVALVTGWLILSEPISTQKIIGILLATLGIYFINKS